MYLLIPPVDPASVGCWSTDYGPRGEEFARQLPRVMRFTDDDAVLVQALFILARRSRTLGYSALQRMAPTVNFYSIDCAEENRITAVTLTVPYIPYLSRGSRADEKKNPRPPLPTHPFFFFFFAQT